MKNSIEINKTDVREGLLKKFEDINPGALHVFLILSAYSEDGKTAKITVEQIRELTEFSPHKVNECLKGLVSAKLIKKTGTSRSRKYEF